jgi:hypothetical protein
LRAELEAAGLLRAEDAFELLRVEPAFELLRAAAFELLSAEFALLLAERLRSPAFDEPLCFVLVFLATSRPLYGTKNTPMQHRLRRARGP